MIAALADYCRRAGIGAEDITPELVREILRRFLAADAQPTAPARTQPAA